jgi:hypothetical protein
MPISITPTLSSSSGYLVDIRDQVMNLVRFIIMNPGGTSDLWEDDLISFRVLATKNEHDRSGFCGILNNRVTNVLLNKFHDYTFEVDFTSEDYGEEGSSRYTVTFHILIATKNNEEYRAPALVQGDISVDKTTNNISLKYSNTADTAELS